MMLDSSSQVAGHRVKTIHEIHEAELVLVRVRFRVISWIVFVWGKTVDS